MQNRLTYILTHMKNKSTYKNQEVLLVTAMELLQRLPLKGHIALAASELLKGWGFCKFIYMNFKHTLPMMCILRVIIDAFPGTAIERWLCLRMCVN